MLVLVILSLSANCYAGFSCRRTDKTMDFAYGSVIQVTGNLRKNKMLEGTGENLPPEMRSVLLVLESHQFDIFIYNNTTDVPVSCLAPRFTLMLSDTELRKGLECFEKNRGVIAKGVVLPAETPIEEIENHILMTATIECPTARDD